MNPELITLGDIFSFEGKDYVYLAKTPDLLYVAEILSVENSKQVIKQSEIAVRRNISTIDSPVYCFTILTTSELRDRVAYMGRPAHDDILRLLNTGRSINDKDLNEIIKTIKNSRAVPTQLKKLIENISSK